MGFEPTVYALKEHRKDVLELIRVCDEADERICSVIAQCPVQVVDYGDNIDCNLISPSMYEEFILPVYERRWGQLKPAGKFICSHWDGFIKPILPYAKRSFLDAIEALTPQPQGDVTVHEIKEALNRTVSFGKEVLISEFWRRNEVPEQPVNYPKYSW
jgi:hypothetical protein